MDGMGGKQHLMDRKGQTTHNAVNEGTATFSLIFPFFLLLLLFYLL